MTGLGHYADPGLRVRHILGNLPADAADGMLPAGCYTDPDFFAFEQRTVFPRSWLCVGRVEQIPNPGDCLSVNPAGEPVLLVRDDAGAVRAFSAICQHRGAILSCAPNQRHPRCPLHFWSYDLTGALVGAPRTSAEELRALRDTIRLPEIRVELWHGFIFVSLDGQAAPLAPSLAKVEPYWAGYEAADLVAIPPKLADTPLP